MHHLGFSSRDNGKQTYVSMFDEEGRHESGYVALLVTEHPETHSKNYHV